MKDALDSERSSMCNLGNGSISYKSVVEFNSDIFECCWSYVIKKEDHFTKNSNCQVSKTTPFLWPQSRSAFWRETELPTAMARWTTEKVWVTLPTNHPGVVTGVWIRIFVGSVFCVGAWSKHGKIGGVFSVHFLSSPTLQLLLQLLSCRDHSPAHLRNDSETSHPKIKQTIFVAFHLLACLEPFYVTDTNIKHVTWVAFGLWAWPVSAFCALRISSPQNRKVNGKCSKICNCFFEQRTQQFVEHSKT